MAVPLAMALLVGWAIIFAGNLAMGGDVATNVWLLVSGVIGASIIMGVLVMFAIYLAREIQEVRRQDSFIDSVTHELKSPLASIKLGLQTMGREAVGQDKREVLRMMALKDVDRLSSFIDDVLQASHLAHTRDRMGMNLSEVDVTSLVQECVESVENRFGLQQGAITYEADAPLLLMSDRVALEIIVRNLIDNAIKYSPQRQGVLVRTEKAGDGSLELRVKDQGIGIPEADLKRVFERFYRVPTESVHKQRGTGLGLFVVSALVRNLGGQVSAHSGGEDQGTEIRVQFPGHEPTEG